MVELGHTYGVAIVKLRYGNIGKLQRTELERDLDDRSDPDIALRAHVATPYVQVMPFGIVKIRPLTLIEDQLAVLDIANWIKGLQGA